jgi:tyrosinase
LFGSWFVWQFEKALQEHTGRCVYVPYWDSERDAEREWESPVLEQDTFGRWDATSDGCVDEGIVSWDGPFGDSWTMDGGTGCVEREFLDASRFAFSGEAEMLSLIANMDEYDGYREDFEMGPHMLVHGLIGGHMGTNWSPADPLFWLHHSNIDRIWTM